MAFWQREVTILTEGSDSIILEGDKLLTMEMTIFVEHTYNQMAWQSCAECARECNQTLDQWDAIKVRSR